MPPLPKKKHTRARKGGRSAHHFLRPASLSVCPACKAATMPHRACPECGYYGGRYVTREAPEAAAKTAAQPAGTGNEGGAR
jgi:large subunit ribosomal protein L32